MYGEAEAFGTARDGARSRSRPRGWAAARVPRSRGRRRRATWSRAGQKAERGTACSWTRGSLNFFRESVAELKKVEWPNQKAVVSGTAVVLIACVIVGAYLWLNDELWKYVVQHVLLR